MNSDRKPVLRSDWRVAWDLQSTVTAENAVAGVTLKNFIPDMLYLFNEGNQNTDMCAATSTAPAQDWPHLISK